MSVGVAFITHRARHHLAKCLPPILNSPLKPKVLVVNSSSQDGTLELAEKMGTETLLIPRNEFNHGTTREKARKRLNTDIVIMMTPDAYAVDQDVLAKLIEPIRAKLASISYARQIAHDGADIFESFSRDFNYPEMSHLRSLADLPFYGPYIYFCSDACAAYCNQALESIGGFSRVLIGEDTVACAKLLNKGHSIAYVAEALVKHSHCYTLTEEFKRSFDTGLARKMVQDLISRGGKDTSRGKEYVYTFCKKLLRQKPHLIPYLFLQSSVKLAGYKIGQFSLNAPLVWKRLFSAQDFYWQ